MIKGNRKLIVSLVALACYTAIMVATAGTVDAFNLGLGMCALVAPNAFANAAEYRYGNNNENKGSPQ